MTLLFFTYVASLHLIFSSYSCRAFKFSIICSSKSRNIIISLSKLFPLPLMHYEDDEGNSREKRIMISRLKCFLPEEMPFNDNEIPFRMLFWYLDPSTLKHDISEILREAIQRPFLCLKKEL
uniref:Uncharacterized protein n=1 Tax=Ananas comosus var. bracteatus TaxID=296719 RepID=A0A6V7QJB9_ANACO|nr:unnamed protein product [Ananas comosus var. bracteatus]